MFSHYNKKVQRWVTVCLAAMATTHRLCGLEPVGADEHDSCPVFVESHDFHVSGVNRCPHFIGALGAWPCLGCSRMFVDRCVDCMRREWLVRIVGHGMSSWKICAQTKTPAPLAGFLVCAIAYELNQPSGDGRSTKRLFWRLLSSLGIVYTNCLKLSTAIQVLSQLRLNADFFASFSGPFHQALNFFFLGQLTW